MAAQRHILAGHSRYGGTINNGQGASNAAAYPILSLDDRTPTPQFRSVFLKWGLATIALSSVYAVDAWRLVQKHNAGPIAKNNGDRSEDESDGAGSARRRRVARWSVVVALLVGVTIIVFVDFFALLLMLLTLPR